MQCVFSKQNNNHRIGLFFNSIYALHTAKALQIMMSTLLLNSKYERGEKPVLNNILGNGESVRHISN